MEGVRAIGPTYTNSTGGPIAVAITYTINIQLAVHGLTINGEIVYTAGNGPLAAGANADASGFNLIVPSGHTYSFVSNGGTCTLVTWRELRP
jgi:hypothetical protein